MTKWRDICLCYIAWNKERCGGRSFAEAWPSGGLEVLFQSYLWDQSPITIVWNTRETGDLYWLLYTGWGYHKPCTIHITQCKQKYNLRLRKFTHNNLPQARFELEFLGPQSYVLPIEPPLLVVYKSFNAFTQQYALTQVSCTKVFYVVT